MGPTSPVKRPNAVSLTGIDIFSSLSASEKANVSKLLVWRRFDSGTHLVSRQQPDTDVYVIQSGRVRVITYSVSGREVAFQELEAGSMFGELSCIDNQPRMADVVALSEVFAAIIPQQQFLRLVEKYPSVAQKVMLRLSAMVRGLGERLYELSTMDVGQRLASELLRLSCASASGSAHIERLPTHLEVASSISSGREVVTRILRQFQEKNLIERNGSGVTIPSVVELRRYANRNKRK